MIGLRNAFWKGNDSFIKSFKKHVVGQKYDLKDIFYNESAAKIYKGVVFPPYNESGSDTNERATRWAHKRDVEDYTQRIFYHENIRYLVEKDSSLSLNYRVIRRITNKEYNRNKAFYSTIGGDIDGNYTGRQQGRTGIIQSSKIDSVGTESSKRSNGHSTGINRYNGKTSSTQRLGGEQNAERRIDVERGRAFEQSVGDKQRSGTVIKFSLNDTGNFSLDDALNEIFKDKKYNEYSGDCK